MRLLDTADRNPIRTCISQETDHMYINISTVRMILGK